MVLRKPEVPCAKPSAECRIPNHLVLQHRCLPLGQQMEYILDTNTKRCLININLKWQFAQ